MNRRALTVGSLIPGSMNVIPVSGKDTTPVSGTNFKKQPSTIILKKQSDKIVVMQNGSKFEIVPVKGTLLDAALNQDKPLQFKCKKGTCGQCTVKVIQGSRLSEPNELEHKKLDKEIENGYRLACQAEIL